MMDKYDYIEIVYRTVLFLTIMGAGMYVMLTTFLLPFPPNPDITWWGFTIALMTIWVIFGIGVSSYLIFVAKGTFRPKTQEELDELALIDAELDAEENDNRGTL
jgi:hypothetical protein